MRTVTRIAIVLSVLAALPDATASARQVATTSALEWALLPLGCPPPATGFRVPCGDYGLLVFQPSTPLACIPRASGREVPKVYPVPARISEQIEQLPVAAPLGFGNTVAAVQAPDPLVPCVEGGCLTPPGGYSGSEDWAAVVDWNDWHGWTTGWTVSHVSGLPVHLVALDDPQLKTALGENIGDGHVLASLCGIAEIVDRTVAAPPRVVSMSFGRLAGATDPVNGSVPCAPGGRLGPCCADGELSCQVTRLLEHLVRSEEVALVASAGNHQEILFPASVDAVLEAGSMDLSAFRSAGRVEPAWETPPEATALTPGYGICLEYPPGEGSGSLWPAPAGSSYASAIFSGWLADTLVKGAPYPARAVSWAPVWSQEKSCHVLSAEPGRSCNQNANLILARILGREVANCWAFQVRDPHLTIQGPVAAEPPVEGLLSLDAWVDNGHNPAPMAEICVPCVTSGDGTGWLTYEGDTGLEAFTGSVRTRPGPAGDLVVDLSASATMTGPEYAFQAIYLRSRENYYPLLHRANGEAAALASIAAGETQSLLLQSFSYALSPDSQSSLIYYICEEGGGADDCFWTSTPILTQPAL